MTSGPHAAIAADDARQRLALTLFDTLWQQYRSRVPYVQQYEQVVRDAGARFVNDHIAFRTIARQQPLIGIGTLARLFEALGYRAAGCYAFPDKHLSALHLQHPNGQFPKLFISELRSWELPADVREALAPSLAQHRHPIDDEMLAKLAGMESSEIFKSHATSPTSIESSEEGDVQNNLKIAQTAQELAGSFCRCWPAPDWDAVQTVNRVSQYGAWTLLHGYSVNHFTSLINSHGVAALDSLDKTVAALRAAGVPMKEDIEGVPGSKLRQSATAAATCDVEVTRDGGVASESWTYAYFELAERGQVTDPESGAAVRFEGFLGPQATQLFEMTRGDQATNQSSD